MSPTARKDHHPAQAGNPETSETSAEKPAPAGQEVSAEERSRLIQERAYGLWERAGKPGGDAFGERFMCEAEAELLAPRATAE
jgi:hypothetical protein